MCIYYCVLLLWRRNGNFYRTEGKSFLNIFFFWVCLFCRDPRDKGEPNTADWVTSSPLNREPRAKWAYTVRLTDRFSLVLIRSCGSSLCRVNKNNRRSVTIVLFSYDFFFSIPFFKDRTYWNAVKITKQQKVLPFDIDTHAPAALDCSIRKWYTEAPDHKTTQFWLKFKKKVIE